MYASIDLLSDKLLRQVKKVKDKSLSTKDKSSIRTDSSQDASEEEVNIVVGAMPEE